VAGPVADLTAGPVADLAVGPAVGPVGVPKADRR